MSHHDHLISVVPGGLYVFLWLVRPRLIVYGGLALEAICFPGTWLERSINYVLWLFNALLALKKLTGFVKDTAENLVLQFNCCWP